MWLQCLRRTTRMGSVPCGRLGSIHINAGFSFTKVVLALSICKHFDSINLVRVYSYLKPWNLVLLVYYMYITMPTVHNSVTCIGRCKASRKSREWAVQTRTFPARISSRWYFSYAWALPCVQHVWRPGPVRT